MKSKVMSDDVKNAVMNGLSSYIADAGPAVAGIVARHAISKEYKCDQLDFLILVEEGMQSSTTVKLIC
ncbi:hypothetical protein [Bifidobacterium psychraerophilum]|nr:hypothetical protein [Bifidobacterium psychraerophilum]